MKAGPALPPAGPQEEDQPPTDAASEADLLLQVARILCSGECLKLAEKRALRQTCKSLRLTVDQTIDELTAAADSLSLLNSKTAMQPQVLTVKAGYLPPETPAPERLARVRKLAIITGQMTTSLGKVMSRFWWICIM
jgi:hypothetical protein